MKGYDTAEYAGTRLIETVIMYKNRPVKVLNCTQFGKQIAVAYADVITDQTSQAFLDDMDLNPPILGYVNVGKSSCHYVTRMPMRKDWKQGVRKNNIITAQGYAPDISLKHLAKTIMNDFPSIGEVVKTLAYMKANLTNACIAFNRDFAADTKGQVWYKSLFVVGRVDLNNGGIKIDPKYEWVREALMEVVGEVA